MMQRCERCGGSVIRFNSGEVSCLNCSKVVVESKLPLMVIGSTMPVAILSRSGVTASHKFEYDDDYDA